MESSKRIFSFEEVGTAPLFVDAIYKGGQKADLSSEVISKLIGCGNRRGFRWVSRRDRSKSQESLPAYVALVTTMREPEWPDFLDVETGIFHYYGDNRQAGKPLASTPGNKLLERIFGLLHAKQWADIPPFLIFRSDNRGKGRRYDVQFLGLAVPGNSKFSNDQDLVAFWRTMGENRFQNYEAYFTVLDTGSSPISREWLRALRDDHANSLKLAPPAWREFVNRGREGIHALRAPRIVRIPKKEEQLACESEDGRQCVKAIYQYFKDTGYYFGFEACAAEIVSMMDKNINDVQLTRPWRDGGRDALGYYTVSCGSNVNLPLKIDFALEAKCFSMSKSVGVKEMSRLISRIRYRQFGIMVTTSSVNEQAYREVIEDGHPILVVTARDIARILHDHGINHENIVTWIESAQKHYERLENYV